MSNPEYILVTYQEGLKILDTLTNAQRYLASQFSHAMTRAEAQAHFDARTLLMRRRFALLDEMELEYLYGEAS